MRNTNLAFVAWLFRSTSGKIGTMNADFQRLIGHTPFFAFFSITFGTLLFLVIAGFVVSTATNSNVATDWTMSCIAVTGVLYYVYSVLAVAHASFKKERRDLFNSIKK